MLDIYARKCYYYIRKEVNTMSKQKKKRDDKQLGILALITAILSLAGSVISLITALIKK